MTSTCAALSMAVPAVRATQSPPSADAFFKPLAVRPSRASSKAVAKFQVRASLKEKVVTGLTAAALTASMIVPDVAEAANGGITPSLNNFLLSIGAGAVVLGAIAGAVIGVSNFDPVKRG